MVRGKTTAKEEKPYISREQRREERRRELEQKRAEEERRAAAAKKRGDAIKKYFVIALCILLAVAVLFGRQLVQLHDLEQSRNEAQKKLDNLQQQIEMLEDELERVSTPEYVESQARFLLRMIRPNETLYVIR